VKITAQQLFKDQLCTCGKCGGEAHLTPIGVLCLKCTFGKGKK
jgi:hypothetical protein